MSVGALTHSAPILDIGSDFRERREVALCFLTIDVGNTQTVYGLFDGEEIVDHWRVATDPRRTSDELSVMTQGAAEPAPDGGQARGG